MAAALVEVCATDAEGNGSVPVLNVHAELDALTDPEDGAGVSEMGRGPVVANETARMLGCDGDIETTIEQQGKPIGIGRKSRKIAGWLRRQVEARDHHCQFPGDGRTTFLQVHHIQHWADGGRTDLDNLVLVCWWHHWFIHESGWHITRDLNGNAIFRKPDWTPHPPRST
jgi:hypothetical protein